MSTDPSARREAASLARRYYAGEIDLDAFLSFAEGQGADPDIAELAALVGHWPEASSPYVGETEVRYRRHVKQLQAVIARLESDG